MAHPKRKISKQRRDKRRTHHKAEVPTLSTCSNCNASVLRHRVCPECGYTYDETVGDAHEGYPAGTLFSDLPDDFACPDCSVQFKEDFKTV